MLPRRHTGFWRPGKMEVRPEGIYFCPLSSDRVSSQKRHLGGRYPSSCCLTGICGARMSVDGRSPASAVHEYRAMATQRQSQVLAMELLHSLDLISTPAQETLFTQQTPLCPLAWAHTDLGSLLAGSNNFFSPACRVGPWGEDLGSVPPEAWLFAIYSNNSSLGA